jgi:hypothetical protein
LVLFFLGPLSLGVVVFQAPLRDALIHTNSRHSGMRHRTWVYPSSTTSLSKPATAELDAQAWNVLTGF